MKTFCRPSIIHRSRLCILLVVVIDILVLLINHIRIAFAPLCTSIVGDSMIPAIGFTYHLFDKIHDRFNFGCLKDALSIIHSNMIPLQYVMKSVMIHDESEVSIKSTFRRHLVSNETNSDDGTSKIYLLFVVIGIIASWALFYYVYCGTCWICALFVCGTGGGNNPSMAALRAEESSRRLQHLLNERMERGRANNNSNNNDTINHPIIISIQEFDSLPTFNYKINDIKVETTNNVDDSSEDAAIRVSIQGDSVKEGHDSTIIQVNIIDQEVNNSNNIVTNEICSICVEDFQSMERVVMLPQCLHVYHVKCIEQWLVQKKSDFCPLCKTKVFLPYNETTEKDQVSSS